MMDTMLSIPQGEGRRATRSAALADAAIIRRAALDAFRKLDPRHLVRNPVIFVTAVIAVLVTILAGRAAGLGAPYASQAGIAACRPDFALYLLD